MTLFLALGVLWGGSFLLIKTSLEGFTPGQVSLLRLALGAATLSAVMLVTGRPWPRGGRQLGHLAAVAVLLFVLPVALYSWAGQHVPTSLAAVLNATTPLMTLLMGALGLREEPLRPPQTAGVLLGALGIVLVMAPWDSAVAAPAPFRTEGGTPFWLAIAACLAATLCYGGAYTWMRKFLTRASPGTSSDPLAMTAAQLLIATAVTALAAPWTGTFATAPRPQAHIIAAVLVLGVFCTGIGYLWNTSVTASWGAVRASQVTYLTPVVGVVLGVGLLAEPFGWRQLLGSAIVMAGIAVTQRGGRRRRTATEQRPRPLNSTTR